MSIEILTVDAFAEGPFQGNPAGVCFLTEPAEERWMQAIAAEMNLSETAFLAPVEDGYHLRWFTPTVEVALCGHATLASAHALWLTERLPTEVDARFHTKSGLLLARRTTDGAIVLDFPSNPPQAAEMPEGLAQALGVEAKWVGRSHFDYLVQVASAATVRSLEPDIRGLAGLDVRGVIVTAAAGDERYDFISRFFAPAAGVDEDPVTGSAHCTLAPFWSERLGKTAMTGFQASARGGVVGVEMAGERVLLTGRAVAILRGQILV